MARLTDVLARQHQELAALLDACVEPGGKVNVPAFERFRRRQLSHIAVEAQVLLPALGRRKRLTPAFQNGLRKDHQAIVVLCLTAPEPDFVHDLRELVLWHQGVEEQPGGLFDLYRKWVGDDAEAERASAALPAIEPPPFVTGAQVPPVLQQVLRQLGLSEPLKAG